MLEVMEIFRSIQGESTWAGCPCTFVRLTGCNLRCRYCDTAYAWQDGQAMSVEAVVEACAGFPRDLVEITGGEPVSQEECPALAGRLLSLGYVVLLETNGTLPLRKIPAGVVKIMDLKCPSSGMSDRICWENVELLSPRDEVKFVIGSREDYEWSRDTARRYDLPARCQAVLFSPVFGEMEPRLLVEWILEDGLNVRFQLQLHKCIWSPNERGV